MKRSEKEMKGGKKEIKRGNTEGVKLPKNMKHLEYSNKERTINA
jgi:hypothetical protein